MNDPTAAVADDDTGRRVPGWSPAPDAAPADDGDRLTRLDIGLLAAVAAVGVAARLWVLRSPLGTLDADEAIVGLMARDTAFRGGVDVFFWGQQYGGSLEALLAAAVFRVVGPGVLALKVVPVVLSATATLLVARLGAQLVGPRRAFYGAAAFWVGTGNYLWWATKARGFYWETLNLGLLFVLLVLRLTRRPDDRPAWLGLGFVGGVGWWTSPHILYFALPGLAWLVVRLARVGPGDATGPGRRLWVPLFALATPAAVVGALPWIVTNVRTGFASFDAPPVVQSSYAFRMRVFFEEGLAVMLGMHALGRWLVDTVFPVLYLVVLAALVVAVVRTRRALGVVALAIAAYPLVFVLFPTNWAVGEGRYLLYLAPLVWLAFATAAPRRLLPLLPVVVFAVAALGLRTIEHRSLPLAVDVLVPNDNDALLDALDEHDVDRAYADYWVAYRVTFETDEEVVVAPDNPDQIRHPRFTQLARADDDAARIFLRGSRREAEFLAGLTDAERCLRRVDAGAYVLYVPDSARRAVVLHDGQTCAVVVPRMLRT